MQVGLVDVGSKIPNLVLMKLKAFYGDKAKFYDPLFDKPDVLYVSKIFDFSCDYQYYPDGAEIIKAGTGYTLPDKLPAEIESQYPDYGLYNCKYAMGFTTRGCIRNCAFCVVPRKEGKTKAVGDIYDFWRGQSHLMLLDNNLTSLPEKFEITLNQLIKERIKTDFNQGLDIRLITPEMARLLAKVRLWKQIHFAFDNVKRENAVRRGIDILVKNGVAKHKLMFYVLIGFDSTPEEDLYRVEMLSGLGVAPFVMPFNKRDRYQKRFARWVNMKATFKSTSWEKYAG